MLLQHDSGGAVALRNQQVLGDDSPLEFDEDGLAEVDDAVGERLLAMHCHIARGQAPGDFDAAVFVDRTPMDDVVADIVAGEADGHLDAVAEEASRQGVLDAIDERQE